MDNSIMIGITELQGTIDSNQPLEERLKAAMKSAFPASSARVKVVTGKSSIVRATRVRIVESNPPDR